MRIPIVAANWKMNKTIADAVEFARSLKGCTANAERVEILLCPPFTALDRVAGELTETSIRLGAQDLFWKTHGAYTGEVSPGMLREVGCSHVLIGHSERRGRFGKPEFSEEEISIFGDNDATVNAKVHAALSAGLVPIVCCGETLRERKADKTDQVVWDQIHKGLAGLDPAEVRSLVLAYEPVWAIGTGEVCEPAEANRVCGLIRHVVGELFDRDTADEIRVQYGGSVNPGNVSDLIVEPDIDGALVGGASLEVASFVAIVNAAAASV